MCGNARAKIRLAVENRMIDGDVSASVGIATKLHQEGRSNVAFVIIRKLIISDRQALLSPPIEGQGRLFHRGIDYLTAEDKSILRWSMGSWWF